MGMIVIGLILSGVGLIVQGNANLSAQFAFERHPEFIIIGSLLQIAAVLFVLVGMKRYFLKDILDELKKLSAPKS